MDNISDIPPLEEFKNSLKLPKTRGIIYDFLKENTEEFNFTQEEFEQDINKEDNIKDLYSFFKNNNINPLGISDIDKKKKNLSNVVGENFQDGLNSKKSQSDLALPSTKNTNIQDIEGTKSKDKFHLKKGGITAPSIKPIDPLEDINITKPKEGKVIVGKPTLANVPPERLMAYELTEEGKPLEVIKYSNSIKSKDPYVNYLKANAFVDLEHLDTAKIIIDTFLKEYPNDLNFLKLNTVTLAEQSIKENDINRSNQLFEKALENADKVASLYPEEKSVISQAQQLYQAKANKTADANAISKAKYYTARRMDLGREFGTRKYAEDQAESLIKLVDKIEEFAGSITGVLPAIEGLETLKKVNKSFSESKKDAISNGHNDFIATTIGNLSGLITAVDGITQVAFGAASVGFLPIAAFNMGVKLVDIVIPNEEYVESISPNNLLKYPLEGANLLKRTILAPVSTILKGIGIDESDLLQGWKSAINIGNIVGSIGIFKGAHSLIGKEAEVSERVKKKLDRNIPFEQNNFTLEERNFINEKIKLNVKEAKTEDVLAEIKKQAEQKKVELEEIKNNKIIDKKAIKIQGEEKINPNINNDFYKKNEEILENEIKIDNGIEPDVKGLEKSYTKVIEEINNLDDMKLNPNRVYTLEQIDKGINELTTSALVIKKHIEKQNNKQLKESKDGSKKDTQIEKDEGANAQTIKGKEEGAIKGTINVEKTEEVKTTKDGETIKDNETKKEDGATNDVSIAKDTNKKQIDEPNKIVTGEKDIPIKEETHTEFEKIKFSPKQFQYKKDIDTKTGVNKDSVEKAKNKIKETGDVKTLTVWEHNGEYELINGHHQYKAIEELKKEGDLPENIDINKIPIKVIEAETPLQAKRLAAIENYKEGDKEGIIKNGDLYKFDNKNIKEKWFDEKGISMEDPYIKLSTSKGEGAKDVEIKGEVAKGERAKDRKEGSKIYDESLEGEGIGLEGDVKKSGSKSSKGGKKIDEDEKYNKDTSVEEIHTNIKNNLKEIKNKIKETGNENISSHEIKGVKIVNDILNELIERNALDKIPKELLFKYNVFLKKINDGGKFKQKKFADLYSDFKVELDKLDIDEFSKDLSTAIWNDIHVRKIFSNIEKGKIKEIISLDQITSIDKALNTSKFADRIFYKLLDNKILTGVRKFSGEKDYIFNKYFKYSANNVYKYTKGLSVTKKIRYKYEAEVGALMRILNFQTNISEAKIEALSKYFKCSKEEVLDMEFLYNHEINSKILNINTPADIYPIRLRKWDLEVLQELRKRNNGKPIIFDKNLSDNVLRKQAANLLKNKNQKKYFNDLYSLGKEISNKDKFNALTQGRKFKEQRNYYPNNVYDKPQDIDIVIENAISGFDKTTAQKSMETGHTITKSGAFHFVDLQADRVFTNLVNDTMLNYHIGNDIKSFSKALKDKSIETKIPQDQIILSDLNEGILERLRTKLYKRIDKNILSKTVQVSNNILRILLFDPLRLAFEIPANLINALGFTHNAKEFAKLYSSADIGLIKMLSEDSGQAFHGRYASEYSEMSKLGVKALEILGIADKYTNSRNFYITFLHSFKKLTGEDFDVGKYKNDELYKKEFKKYYKEALSEANYAAEELFPSNIRFMQSSTLKLLGGEKSIGKVLSSLNYVMATYMVRESQNFLWEMKNLALNTNEGRATAARRISALLISNTVYGIGTMVRMSALGLTATTLLKQFYPDDKELQIAVKKYEEKYKDKLNETITLQAWGDEFIASLFSLGTIRLGNLLKLGEGGLLTAMNYTLGNNMNKDEMKALNPPLYALNDFAEKQLYITPFKTKGKLSIFEEKRLLTQYIGGLKGLVDLSIDITDVSNNYIINRDKFSEKERNQFELLKVFNQGLFLISIYPGAGTVNTILKDMQFVKEDASKKVNKKERVMDAILEKRINSFNAAIYNAKTKEGKEKLEAQKNKFIKNFYERKNKQK